jgi:pyruvate dehydrogenase E1 component alpha subunit
MSAPVPVEPLPYSSTDVAAAIGPGWESTLLTAYRWMVLARTLDARMQALQRQGRIGFYGAATGHEAVNVAAGLVTTPDDWIFPGLREQLVALVRGASLAGYAHSIYANDRDVARGRQMPCHPTAREVHYVSMSSVIGTQISHAVGLAYALQQRHDPGVALAFFGDGATSSNDFHAGLNFAAVFGLPVVFACANNQWAISFPVEHQTAAPTLASKAAAYGLPGQRVDGTDFVATFRALHDSLRSVRSGGGPLMLEFVAYRMAPHSTSDDPSRYQPAGWAEHARRLDPVRRLESWLQSNGLLPESTEKAIREESDEQVREAVRAAEEAPPPSPASLTEDIYGVNGSREESTRR